MPKTLEEDFIANVGQWSLQSNAYQHERVLEICKNELEKMPSNIILSEIINTVKERQKQFN